MKVLFTPSARSQFLDAVSFILADNPSAALRFRKKAERALRRLARFPQSGRRISEFPDLPHRELIVPPYRFFYRREGKVLWIVACWHGAQLPARPNL
ncbi:MAG TPA: type II toxin-antitoxin system RelE/ParE family toxin [Terriglobia bacterium]|nr:type II toxin-antitoxin system RelE/ParE family toxin [Terriglobia bacterium]